MMTEVFILEKVLDWLELAVAIVATVIAWLHGRKTGRKENAHHQR